MKLDGEHTAFAEISGSEASQRLLELLSSSAKAVNSLASLQEIKSKNVHSLGAQSNFKPWGKARLDRPTPHSVSAWTCALPTQLWCKCDGAGEMEGDPSLHKISLVSVEDCIQAECWSLHAQ